MTRHDIATDAPLQSEPTQGASRYVPPVVRRLGSVRELTLGPRKSSSADGHAGNGKRGT